MTVFACVVCDAVLSAPLSQVALPVHAPGRRYRARTAGSCRRLGCAKRAATGAGPRRRSWRPG